MIEGKLIVLLIWGSITNLPIAYELVIVYHSTEMHSQ